MQVALRQMVRVVRDGHTLVGPVVKIDGDKVHIEQGVDKVLEVNLSEVQPMPEDQMAEPVKHMDLAETVGSEDSE